MQHREAETVMASKIDWWERGNQSRLKALCVHTPLYVWRGSLWVSDTLFRAEMSGSWRKLCPQWKPSVILIWNLLLISRVILLSTAWNTALPTSLSDLLPTVAAVLLCTRLISGACAVFSCSVKCRCRNAVEIAGLIEEICPDIAFRWEITSG